MCLPLIYFLVRSCRSDRLTTTRLNPRFISLPMESLVETFFSNQFAIVLSVGFLLLAIAEAGYRMGARVPPKDDDAFKSEISGYQSAVLGLLALLLGFTFSMSLSHYDLRRNLVIQEANSIGTTYLRATM